MIYLSKVGSFIKKLILLLIISLTSQNRASRVSCGTIGFTQNYDGPIFIFLQLPFLFQNNQFLLIEKKKWFIIDSKIRHQLLKNPVKSHHSSFESKIVTSMLETKLETNCVDDKMLVIRWPTSRLFVQNLVWHQHHDVSNITVTGSIVNNTLVYSRPNYTASNAKNAAITGQDYRL